MQQLEHPGSRPRPEARAQGLGVEEEEPGSNDKEQMKLTEPDPPFLGVAGSMSFLPIHFQWG